MHVQTPVHAPGISGLQCIGVSDACPDSRSPVHARGCSATRRPHTAGHRSIDFATSAQWGSGLWGALPPLVRLCRSHRRMNGHTAMQDIQTSMLPHAPCDMLIRNRGIEDSRVLCV